MTQTGEILAALERAPSIVLPLVREVPQMVLKRRLAPRKWSAHEHACHLATVHPVMSSRLDLMLEHDKPFITPFFPSAKDEAGALLEVDLNEALERFTVDREHQVWRLQGLSASDWQRTAEHGEYKYYSVFIMFRHLAMHDVFHAYRIEELLLKRDWE